MDDPNDPNKPKPPGANQPPQGAHRAPQRTDVGSWRQPPPAAYGQPTRSPQEVARGVGQRAVSNVNQNAAHVGQERDYYRNAAQVEWPTYHQQKLDEQAQRFNAELGAVRGQLDEQQALTAQLHHQALARDNREHAEASQWRAQRNHYNSRALIHFVLVASAAFGVTWLVFFR